MNEGSWKIGELATATGVTVRTLRYFHQIGLLCPAGRSSAGHRVYTDGDVRRLYQILALRELRLPLSEIARSLDGADLQETIQRQIEQAGHRLAAQHALLHRLSTVAEGLRQARQPSIDQLMKTMEAMMQARHFTPDQLAQFEGRHRELGQEGLAHRLRGLEQLAAQAGTHAGRGTDPADPAVQELARRWTEAVLELVGGDRTALSALYDKIDAKGAEAATKGILTSATWSYLKRAFATGYPGPA
ncbi:MerR family transcriptional regulator [Nonomuraea monospora]|uniref:MerR family transcriptional regulator n=1 Tax=Nonomuraea monospora TaxID=568818 RepID=A0ABN3CHG3_9ACTN